MNALNFYGLEGYLTQAINNASTILAVDGTLSGQLQADFVNGSSETYLSITSGSVSEVVRVVDVSGNMLAVVRGIDTTPASFPFGSKVAFALTSQAILTNIGAVSTAVQITGTGLAEVTNPVLNTWDINVPSPAFTGVGGISILGTWPNLQIVYEARGCCGEDTVGGAGGAITDIQGGGIATAFAVAGLATVTVTAPVFSGTGVTITGSWPNYNFVVPSDAGGTVTSVAAGVGISITGAPALNPTVSVTNTGVVAGTYGGVQINARGQIVAVPPTLNPVSIVLAGTPTLNVGRSADTVTLGIDSAAVGVEGTVVLADETDPFNPLDNTRAATPAIVALALESVVVADVEGADAFTGEADAAYVNTLSSVAKTIVLLAGEKALIMCSVTMLDGTTPTTPVPYGLAVFDATPVRLKSNRTISQCQQSMSFVLNGPINTTIAPVTTAVPGTASVVSSNLSFIKF